MIFVTVGTHEQQFNRILKKIDEMKRDGKIKGNVIVQTGFSDYELKYCENHKLISYDEMDKYISEADIVITHGGPASFIAPLKKNKIPIVVPRQKKFGEHVNDHQLLFAKEIEKRLNNILVVENDEQLEEYILNYDVISKKLSKEIKSNTKKFNADFKKMIDKMFGE